MITLPFPASILAGHANGKSPWAKISATKEHRAWAAMAAAAARYVLPNEGDITVHITFYPPHDRGDRVNYPNRCKPYYDGIAEALGVNDKRFVPHFKFCLPDKANPRVEVMLGKAGETL